MLPSKAEFPPALLQALERTGKISTTQFGKLSNLPAQQLLAQLQKAQLSSMDMALAMGHHSGLPVLDLSAVEPRKLPLKSLDQKLASGYQALPLLSNGKRLVLAMADPTNAAATKDIRLQTGASIELMVVEFDKLAALIAKLYPGKSQDPSITSSNHFTMQASINASEFESSDGQETSLVKYIESVFETALSHGASDIHFEPHEKFYRVRIRVDGSLNEISSPPILLKEKIASRLKVISRMNIAEKRIPQDGRVKLQLGDNKEIAFRVSSLPTVYGEKLVLRVLNSSSENLHIDNLGYDETQKNALLRAIERPYGMVLVTGPTGSGKTVALYTFLSILNRSSTNISTVEDPAEITLAGINQVNVDEKSGLTFASALRAFLRQDPDVIMVGEIRDLETAEISIKAAQTGHLVLSTLHTNDAPSTLERLRNMGIPNYNIAASVILITAQRLVKKLCHCKKELHVPTDVLLEAGFHENDLNEDWPLYAPNGCEHCYGSGYKGRVGLFQVMPISDALVHLILEDAGSRAISKQANLEGVSDLRASGLQKVRQGLTSLDEILAATVE